MAFARAGALLWLSAAAAAAAAQDDSAVRLRVRRAVQPVLHAMAHKYNMSFSFGYADASGTEGLAAGIAEIDFLQKSRRMSPDDLVPLGSVTKPWTAVLIMQAVERGQLSLDDAAGPWIDPVLSRLWNLTMEQLWGLNVTHVRIRDLLGMTSGFADYDDYFLEHYTLRFSADDAGPQIYLKSSAKQGFVCAPRTCASYAGTNYILLGLVLVKLTGVWSWQDLNQLSAISSKLWATGRYQHTSFLKLGRCVQYEGVVHQWAWSPKRDTQIFDDLAYDSCLNGWTMGNIASTGHDLAAFFYDLFTLSPEDGGYLNATTLQTMMPNKTLVDTWCQGESGYGACTYGMGLLSNQVGQDVFALQDSNENASAIRIFGHPGEDWGSGCSPCGYNPTYGFGICMAYTSVVGMNCSGDFNSNMNAVQEATCLAYDAVLSAVGGPRLDCSAYMDKYPELRTNCTWRRSTRPTRAFSPKFRRALEAQAQDAAPPEALLI